MFAQRCPKSKIFRILTPLITVAILLGTLFQTVTPIVSQTSYTLTYTADLNGTIDGISPQIVNQGADGSAVTATPNAGYHFVSWSDGILTATRTDTNVQANISVTATFAVNTFTLTYTAGANGSITGTSPQTVNQGADGSAVTATPNAGYHFVSWSDGILTATRTDTNVQANISVTATFAVNTFTLTYTAGANGSITGTSPQTVNQGADGSAVTATPNAGYHFVSWSDGILTATRTDTNVQANISVTATFAVNTFTLTYTAGANGSITGTSPQTVNQGADGSAVTATPNAGYHFVSWSDGILTATRTDTNVQANISVTATFAVNTFTLTYTAGANGSITGTSPQTVNQGADGSAVTATPNAGYHFVSWSDGILTATRTDTNVQANISVTATFAVNTFTLTYTAGANGSITGTSPQTVNQGADGSAVTATPNAGYHFVSWSDGILTATRTDTNVQANISVTATFAVNTFTLTYTAGANGSITGTSPQTVNQGADGSAVTATPNAGYHFVSWSDGILTATRTDTNVQANISVTATFAVNTFTLTYTAGANGSITGTSPQTVNQGADGSAVTATPNAGYHFVSWSDGILTATRTDTNVQANISVTATFAVNTFTLTYTAGANGSITGTSPQTVNQGADGSAVTATPNAGYHFVSWSDGILTATRTDTNVQANISVTATFAVNTFTLTYTAGANGSITGTSPQTVNQGADGSAVTATPNAGYHFVSWSDGILTATRTDTNVQANISVTATFAVNTFTLTYTAGANGSITGTSPQTVNQGADGSAVTATPNAGYHFVSWSDGILTATRTDTNVQANISVTATFAVNTFTLTYTAGANGSITGTSPQTVNQGADGSAVTATPNAGYHFVSWSDGILTATRTDTNVQANISVTATFAVNTFTLTYTAGANGSITGTSPQTVNQGADGSAVTATPNAGYHFVSWSDGILTATRTDTNVQANISVTATFAVNTFTLTYTAGANGSITGTSPQTVNQGADGSAVTATPNAGYHFVSWSDGILTATRTDTNVQANISVTATFAVNTFTLTYTAGANGSITGTSPQTVNQGADGSAVTATPNAGYHFVSWSDGILTATRTDTNVQANISVTATFAVNTFTLTYTAGANGSITGTSPQTVNQGADGSAVTATPNAGYHFVSWSDGILTATRTDTNVQANISVTATFAVNTFTLTYTAGANGSITGTSPQTVNQGADGSAVTATPNAGYHFVSWSDGILTATRTDTNVQANISVTATFAVNTFTLTYTAGANGSITGTSPQTVNQGADGSAVTATPNAGYHFVSWSDGILTATRTDTNVQANISVTATFAVNTFTLTYTAGANGSITGTSPQTVNQGADGSAVTATPNAGYHFVSWSDGILTATRTDTNVQANISVTATFAVNTFTLTYTAGANGSITGTSPQTVNQGADGSAVTATPNAGYHFVSWSDGILTATRTDTNVTSNITVTANFAIDTHTVTFVLGTHGTLTSGDLVQTIAHGAAAVAPTFTTEAGWIFIGWDTAFDNVTSDLTITAKYSQDTYTLTLNIVGSGSIAKSPDQPTYSYGTVVTLTPTPAAGWSFDAFSGDTTTNTITMDGNKTVTATFTFNSYTINFDSAGGSPVVPITQEFGTAIIPPDNPTRTGYTFDGWSPAIPATMPASNITCVAQWTAINYTISFNSQGGSTVANASVAFGATVTQPTDPTRTGYTFGGWFKEAACTTAWNFTSDTITGNTTLYAKWTINQYTITFNSDGGSAVSPITQDYGTAVVAPANPTKSGYTFNGWSPAVPATMPASNTTCVAQWTAAGGGGGGGGGFGNQLIGIGLSGTSPFMDPNGRSITAGEIKTSDGKVSLSVPVGVYVWNAAGAAQSFLSAAPSTNPPSAPPQNSLVMAFELGPNGVTFNPAVILSFNYSDSDIPAGVREADLYIAWWNGTQWVKLTGTVDSTTNTVSAQITHFTSFALIAQQAPATTPPPTTIPPTTNPPTTSPPTTNPPTTPVPTQSEPAETPPGSNPTSAAWIIPLLFLLASTTLGIILFWRSRKPEAELKYTNRK
ncbi:MAG: InlB B-repeat-containing protein [Dehalogenimonas sp.]